MNILPLFASAALAAPVVALSLLAQPAAAADDLSKDAPVETVSALSGFFIHVGPAGLALSESADVSVAGTLNPGADISIDPHLSAVVEAGYFFTPNIAVSFTGGLPPTVDIMGAGNVTGLGRLGTMTYGPATLTGTYHFMDFGRFQPYIGAGPTFMIAFDTKDAVLQNLHVDHAIGFAVQIGADFMIDEHWGAFVDFKKAYLRTKATGTLFGAPVDAKVVLDPAVFHAGISYRF
jgi:outer membrane protein